MQQLRLCAVHLCYAPDHRLCLRVPPLGEHEARRFGDVNVHQQDRYRIRDSACCQHPPPPAAPLAAPPVVSHQHDPHTQDDHLPCGVRSPSNQQGEPGPDAGGGELGHERNRRREYKAHGYAEDEARHCQLEEALRQRGHERNGDEDDGVRVQDRLPP
eukprot:612348-Hanusia_phi.AAC.1